MNKQFSKDDIPSLAFGKMQIKTTLRVHLNPEAMIITKKNNPNNKYWSGCRQKGTLICIW